MSETGSTLDLAILGGEVVDGSGRDRVRADVGVRDGRIVAVGDLGSTQAGMRLDASGQLVCPGFVDIHTHADLMTLAFPEAVNKIQQGITTEVVGNCGSGIAPAPTHEFVTQLRRLQSSIDVPDVEWDWIDLAGYLDRVAAATPAVSVAVLVGHVPLRASVVGFDARPPTEDELTRMQAELDRALRQGAVGMSLGLMRPPSSYATIDEMVALGEVLARHDALLAVHMRDYAGGLLDAVAEMLEVAERARCRLQVSHLTAVGEANWGLVRDALAAIDDAVQRGIDVRCDIYPYLAGSTSLSQKLPRWALDGGLPALRHRLADPMSRRRLATEMEQGDPRWDLTLLGYVPGAPELNGLTVADIAEQQGRPAAEVVLDLLQDADPTMIAFGRSEDDLKAVLAHPRAMIGSDGLVVLPPESSGGSLPHPRAFGAYPGFLQRYVREDPVVPWERAVQMCTSAPASRVQLDDRGRVAPDARGDVVVFDPETVAETSTYVAPRSAPIGITHVVANGAVVVRDGQVTGQRSNGPARRRSPLT